MKVSRPWGDVLGALAQAQSLNHHMVTQLEVMSLFAVCSPLPAVCSRTKERYPLWCDAKATLGIQMLHWGWLCVCVVFGAQVHFP